MIAHALTIIVNELNHHLTEVYGISANHAPTGLRNISSEQFPPQPGVESATQECLNLTLVNIKEEPALRNAPTADPLSYKAPPLALNLLVVLSATHASYPHALLMLGRAIQFFHGTSMFESGNVSPESVTKYAPEMVSDRLSEFRLNMDLYSPTLEETSQIWALLKSPQAPSAIYQCRLLNVVTETAKESKPVSMLERRLGPVKFNKD